MKIWVLACFMVLCAGQANAADLPDDNRFDILYLEQEQEQEEAEKKEPDNQMDDEEEDEKEQVQSAAFVPGVGRLEQVLSWRIGQRSGADGALSQYIASLIINLSAAYDVDPILAASLFEQESGYQMGAHSSAGAIGIAQLMPETARSMGRNPYQLEDNIQGGIEYLSYQLRRFSGAGDLQSSFAIAAYNAGAGAVYRYGDVPPYQETRNHVTAVAGIYQAIQGSI